MRQESVVRYSVTGERVPEAIASPPNVTDPALPKPAVGARVERYKRRHWAAYDAAGILVCVCVYRKGAEEVVRRVAPPVAPPE